MKLLIITIFIIVFIFWAFSQGMRNAWTWLYKSKVKPTVGYKDHSPIIYSWIATTAWGFSFLVAGLLWDQCNFMWWDVILIGLSCIMMWWFNFEGMMFYFWNKLNPNAHPDKWKSHGTNPTVSNLVYKVRRNRFYIGVVLYLVEIILTIVI